MVLIATVTGAWHHNIINDFLKYFAKCINFSKDNETIKHFNFAARYHTFHMIQLIDKKHKENDISKPLKWCFSWSLHRMQLPV